jgi:NAD(P)-dependent dehydrogenase (short-subunit alcohol dehydrogenase family)
MTQSGKPGTQPSIQDVALIVGGGPGISSSCARLFAKSGMRVSIAARNPDKPVLEDLEKTHGVRRYACDASEPASVESLFQNVVRDLGAPTLVVHNIDGRVTGIFGKAITEADPGMVLETLRNSAFSAFLVGQRAAQLMRDNTTNANDHLHERERGAQRVPIERRLCNGMSCQVRTGPEHGKGTDAAGHPHCKCAD